MRVKGTERCERKADTRPYRSRTSVRPSVGQLSERRSDGCPTGTWMDAGLE